MKLYHYPKCSTCRKAIKYLEAKGATYQPVDIVQTPPSQAELKRMLGYVDGEVKKLFNTSGEMYRELGLKDKVGAMKPAEAIRLLAQHGKLIKRPFLLADAGGAVGFKEAEWEALLG
jgi:arsenate reductase